MRESRILGGLEAYYRGEGSLGYVAGELKIPLRALMEFMVKQRLPYYWQKEDRDKGLKKISELRSSVD